MAEAPAGWFHTQAHAAIDCAAHANCDIAATLEAIGESSRDGEG